MPELSIREKAALALQSLPDSCEILAGMSGGMKRGEAYDAYFVPETFWYNRVLLRPGCAAPEGLPAVLAAEVRAGRLPPLLGWLDGDYPDTLLFPALKQAGYVPMTKQYAMYLSLEGWTASEAPPQVEAMRTEEAEAWSDMTARGFGKPPETGGMVLLARARAADFLLWRESGEMLGGTMLICKDGNAGIHEVSTLPEQRRRGIGQALVRRALDIAALGGCKRATLQASELGLALYRSLGFEEVGVIHNWILPK